MGGSFSLSESESTGVLGKMLGLGGGSFSLSESESAGCLGKIVGRGGGSSFPLLSESDSTGVFGNTDGREGKGEESLFSSLLSESESVGFFVVGRGGGAVVFSTSFLGGQVGREASVFFLGGQVGREASTLALAEEERGGAARVEEEEEEEVGLSLVEAERPGGVRSGASSFLLFATGGQEGDLRDDPFGISEDR